MKVDVAILGGGFGGSLLALILRRIGLVPVVVDRGRHPRLTLGESSTPVAGLVLQQLARRYDLPRIAPLAEYGSWQAAYPALPCGLKRGFTYYRHQAGRPFEPLPGHPTELLVAASHAEDDADTHWFRPDFDAFLWSEVLREKIAAFDQCDIQRIARPQPCDWHLSGTRLGKPIEIQADFVVDATGDGRVLARWLGQSLEPRRMHTNSRCLYGHFTGLRRWEDLLADRGCHIGDYLFRCDDSALHHLFDDGWMYVLPFNNGVTSAGFMIDAEQSPLDAAVSAEAEWQQWMSRYPSLAWQFAEARLTELCGPLRRTARLQKRVEQAAGPDWAMLPLTAYTFDALHSTGNAHNLCGIERLACILEDRDPRRRAAALQRYDERLQVEIDHVDRLVHGCYLALNSHPHAPLPPDVFAGFSMLYFAGATMSEHLRRNVRDLGRAIAEPPALLLADDPVFRGIVAECHAEVLARTQGRGESGNFNEFVGRRIRNYNIAGLCDVTKCNIYPFG